jgi:hypothetical protein
MAAPLLLLIGAVLCPALVAVAVVIVLVLWVGEKDPRRAAYWESFSCMYIIFVVIFSAILIPAIVYVYLTFRHLPR